MDTSQLVRFPSGGLPYEGTPLGNSLIDGHSVKIRSYNAEDSHMLTADTNDSYTFYRTILSRLITMPQLDTFDNILLSDAIGVIVAIKLFAFGPKYDIPALCENNVCERIFYASSNVATDFHMCMLEDFTEPDENGVSKAFKWRDLELIVSNSLTGAENVVQYHLPTILDEQKVTQNINHARNKKQLSKNEMADRSRYRLIQFIDKIDGKALTVEAKLRWLGQLPVGVPEEISRAMEKNNVGFIDGMLADCPYCGYSNIVKLNITPKFFRAADRVDGAVR